MLLDFSHRLGLLLRKTANVILKDMCERFMLNSVLQMCCQVAHRSKIRCEPSGLFLC